MDRLLAIGEEYGIPIIEDAAEAIGSVYHGKRAGSMGTFGAFSFHGTKTLTTGEGGMFVTNDAELYERVFTLEIMAEPLARQNSFGEIVGFKYKMSNIQAAIGCAQMERIEELTQRKREIFAQYREKLEDLRCYDESGGTGNNQWSLDADDKLFLLGNWRYARNAPIKVCS